MLIDWKINKEKVTDLDYKIILFLININNNNLVENSVYNSQYNFEKADWKMFAKKLLLQSNKENFLSKIDNLEISKKLLETKVEKLKDIILIIANKAILKKKISEKSKSW